MGALVLLLVLIQTWGALAADPCDFTPQNSTVWYGLPSAVKTCFNAIPFNDTTRQTTLSIMRKIFALYSFSDISQAGLEPFQLSVRFHDRFPAL
jgi:hypothetical protein